MAQQETPSTPPETEAPGPGDGRGTQAPSDRRQALRTIAAWSAVAPLTMILLDSTRTYAGGEYE